MSVYRNSNYNGLAVFNPAGDCIYFNAWVEGMVNDTAKEIEDECEHYDGDTRDECQVFTFADFEAQNDFSDWELLSPDEKYDEILNKYPFLVEREFHGEVKEYEEASDNAQIGEYWLDECPVVRYRDSKSGEEWGYREDGTKLTEEELEQLV